MPCPIVFTGINIPINIDICNTFAVYFQIFATFGYKKVKNSENPGKAFLQLYVFLYHESDQPIWLGLLIIL